jgi:CMP-N-acetylneuraminic acid synthetase
MSVPAVTALMPMKAHSERVKGKNVRPLCGKPLFHWMLDALRSSRHVTRIVIDSDSDAIGSEAERLGATYLRRPAHLLGDMVRMNPLIDWDLRHVEGEFFLQTHATNPLLTAGTIDQAIERFFATGDHDSLFTVNAIQTRFYWPDGRPINHDLGHDVRSQDLPPIYEENSCLYLFSRAGFTAHGRRIGARPLLFPIDPLEAVDIDEEYQWQIAEALMARRLASAGVPDAHRSA